MSKFIFKKQFLIFISLCLFFSANIARAQTASISYQGKLNDGGVPANGQYDFVFKLYNQSGVQFSFDVPVNDVPVTNGIFTVLIPFEQTPGIFLIGSRKFLEIAVRPGASTGDFTTLSPRQEFGSVPSAVSSLFANNADALGGIAANQYLTTTNAGTNFIQNSTSPQTAHFNISGNGAVGGFFSAGTLRIGSNTPVGTVASFGGFGDFRIDSNGSSGGRFIVKENGDVGINTGPNNVNYTLHVLGNSGLRVQKSAIGGTVASFGSVGNFQIDASQNPGGRFAVLENGNVGIGIAAPIDKLQVNGNVRVTNGFVYITNPNTLVITSPNGACWGLTVTNSGTLATFPTVACP